jgi:hypothetical protein
MPALHIPLTGGDLKLRPALGAYGYGFVNYNISARLPQWNYLNIIPVFNCFGHGCFGKDSVSN